MVGKYRTMKKKSDLIFRLRLLSASWCPSSLLRFETESASTA